MMECTQEIGPLPLCVYSVACHHASTGGNYFSSWAYSVLLLLFLREPWHVLWQIGTIGKRKEKDYTVICNVVFAF
jgi:hypothetical protein